MVFTTRKILNKIEVIPMSSVEVIGSIKPSLFVQKLNAITRTATLRDALNQSYIEEGLWQLIRKFWLGKSKNVSINNINRKTNDLDKSDEINNFFSEIGSKLAENISTANEDYVHQLESQLASYPPIFEFNTLTNHDVAILIRELKPSTSCGVD